MLSLAAFASSSFVPTMAPMPHVAPRVSSSVVMGPIADAAARKMLFRLEYTVNSLSDKLGVPPPVRLPTYDDETWISVLEEVHPYLERSWTSGAQARAEEELAMPDDALNPDQRSALREMYVQRLEAQVSLLSDRDVPSMVSRAPEYATRANDEAYVEELEEVISQLRYGRFYTASGSVW